MQFVVCGQWYRNFECVGVQVEVTCEIHTQPYTQDTRFSYLPSQGATQIMMIVNNFSFVYFMHFLL